MNDTIDQAIKTLIENSAKRESDEGDALKYTQSALNLAHVKQVLSQIKGD